MKMRLLWTKIKKKVERFTQLSYDKSIMTALDQCNQVLVGNFFIEHSVLYLQN